MSSLDIIDNSHDSYATRKSGIAFMFEGESGFQMEIYAFVDHCEK